MENDHVVFCGWIGLEGLSTCMNVSQNWAKFFCVLIRRGLISGMLIFVMSGVSAAGSDFISDDASNRTYVATALAWLNGQPDHRFTIQAATIFGLKSCQSEAKKYSANDAYCFESSTVPNRWALLVGRYPSSQIARRALNSVSTADGWVNYIPRIMATRCERAELTVASAAFCSNGSAVVPSLAPSIAPSERSVSKPIRLVSESHVLAAKNENEPAIKPKTQKQTAAILDANDRANLFEPLNCNQKDVGAQTDKQNSLSGRRPGYPVLAYDTRDCNPNRVSPPKSRLLADPAPVPDRWRIVDSLGYAENLWDPYNNNNPLKGDKPIFGKPGKEWFFNLSAISDLIYEPRRFPVPVGAATTRDAGQLDLIGKGDQYIVNENLIVESVLYRGDTVFRPPDHEFRLISVFNINHVVVDERGLLKADPAEGTVRNEDFIGIQGAFWDYHIRNVSDRYDFDSFRIGIQPFSSDFRGFLFQDNQLGIRLFGTRKNNIFQYNLAWFRRLEKEINSGLNDISQRPRKDDVFIANLYWQDFPRLGFISQASITHNRNREGREFLFDDNNFIARPSSLGFERGRDYDITYLGLSGDGHFGRNNLSYSAYYATGDQSNGVFTNEKTDVDAYFLAAEFSRDFDWIRAKISFLHTSGDDNPFDNKERGFDAIFENPQFAGGDTAFFIRQNVPLIGGGRVALNGRNSIIPSLRSSKELGQSNFTNPGLTLLGLGADLELTPQTRLSFNLNQMWFDETAVLELARNQINIDRNVGLDISTAIIWRPLATQNVVFRLSGAVLEPGKGFRDLYGERTPYSILANLILAY